jgi:hypothetical protein
MEKILEILSSSPVVSIVCTTVVILALIYILRNQIVAYIKKKYNLFDEQEVISQINLAVKENNKRKSILKELENRQNEIKSNRNQNS